MRWFRNFSIMTRMFTLVLTMILLLLAVALAGWSTNRTIIGIMNSMYLDYARPAISMSKMESLAIQNRRMILNMSILDDAERVANYERKIAENKRVIGETVERYSAAAMNPEERRFFENLKRAEIKLNAKRDEAMRIAKLPRAEMPEGFLLRLVTGGDIAEVEEEYIEAFEKIVRLLTDDCEERDVWANEEGGRGTVRVVAVSVAAVIAGLFLSVVVAHTIIDPIKKIQERIALFADGDLVSKFPTEGRDEIAAMGCGLQNMADKLDHILASVQKADENIHTTAEEFSALAEETHAVVEEFRLSVEQVGSNLDILASTGEEVNASVKEVAIGAQTIADRGTDIASKVDDAMGAGENGMSAVRRAASGIEEVARNASEAAQSVQGLGNRIRRIQDFVSQIGGIADQTNLLALNAAIEAARAGEAGRGFSVVAEEVRKLAEESNIAAKNIADLASSITKDLETVVNMSLANAEGSEGARELSKETEQVIATMLNYLKEISAATQDLAAVSEEQAASSEEISSAVQDIATKVLSTAEAGEKVRAGTGDVAFSSERMAIGADSLSRLAEDMGETMAFFITEEEESAGKGRGKTAKKAFSAS
ncbi:MAG: methyl-accepting chemotaxis protein [Synergistaceae bacterium]|nr:methyl-accepting chemotaxis protein [Synergistaceae bacterium]